jgi:hypothetical protein
MAQISLPIKSTGKGLWGRFDMSPGTVAVRH